MRNEQDYPRVYAGINLDAVIHNLEEIHKHIQNETKVIAVVKTNAYGHGAVPIAQAIEHLKYLHGYAVATAQEGIVLRKHGIQKPILILGHSFPKEYRDILDWHLTPTVISMTMAQALSGLCVENNTELQVHVKIDTGMSRIGYQVDETAIDEIFQISQLPGITIEGMFTHFAKADEIDKTHVAEQYRLFEQMIQQLEEKGLNIPIKHCSNSAAIMDLPHMNMDVVRAGIILYGLLPSDEVRHEQMDLRPAMELKSKVIFVKELEAGRSISYGGTHVLTEKRKIATIPVGYGDGYPRQLSNRGYVFIRGQKAPICGRICMDQFMVDVTDIPDVQWGDDVTLIGRDGDRMITMEELGELSGRFNYEFACDIGERVPRVFYRNGWIVATIDNFES